MSVDVMLNRAKKVVPPPAPAPVVAQPPPAAKSGPAGQPQQVSVPRVLEGDFVGKNPRRDRCSSCSGNTRTTMLQINQADAGADVRRCDVVYYVIGGEGTMRAGRQGVEARAQRLRVDPARRLALVRAKGNRMLILLSVLGGEACDAPK
jgi:hypothetical protein